ncbi:MAG TPA: nuclear transport factor 2 family protein [Lacunisphaera sp.]
MKKLLPVLASLLLPLAALADTPATDPAQEKAAVLSVVQRFFDALHAKDGEALRATCQPGAQITAGRLADSGFVTRQRSIEADIAQLAEAKEVWLERMWSPTVHINGRIAMVWTRYDFHRDGKLSHNGTDCFTLLKTDTGWKIACAAYSVEPATQTENPAGPPQ